MSDWDPTPDEIAAARAVIRAAKLARLRDRRAAMRAGIAVIHQSERRYPTAEYACAYCGLRFESRVYRLRSTRYCSHVCREMAYQRRKRLAAVEGSLLFRALVG